MPRKDMDEIPVDEHYAYDPEDSDVAGASLRSIASSVHDFRYENGRRYHGYRDGGVYYHCVVSRQTADDF